MKLSFNTSLSYRGETWENVSRHLVELVIGAALNIEWKMRGYIVERTPPIDMESMDFMVEGNPSKPVELIATFVVLADESGESHRIKHEVVFRKFLDKELSITSKELAEAMLDHLGRTLKTT